MKNVDIDWDAVAIARVDKSVRVLDCEGLPFLVSRFHFFEPSGRQGVYMIDESLMKIRTVVGAGSLPVHKKLIAAYDVTVP